MDSGHAPLEACRSRQGVPSQCDQKPTALPADNHVGWICTFPPCGAQAESRWQAPRETKLRSSKYLNLITAVRSAQIA
jgi:hypothetical protein